MGSRQILSWSYFTILFESQIKLDLCQNIFEAIIETAPRRRLCAFLKGRVQLLEGISAQTAVWGFLLVASVAIATGC